MVRKTFSICDREVLEWLGNMERGLQSKYVVGLIRKDMKGKSEDRIDKVGRGISKDEVIGLILEYGRKVDKGNNRVIDNKVINAVKELMNL